MRHEQLPGGLPSTVYFAIENLTNRSYWASVNPSVLTIGNPHTFKAILRVRF